MRKTILHCKQLNGIFPMEVPSETDPDKTYVVVTNPWANRSERHICNCGSYRYRGYCKHQKIAHMSLCGWNEQDGPEVPSDEQRKDMICPRCGNAASLAVYDIPDPEEDSE